MNQDDLSQFSMMDLFRLETESHTKALTAGLLALERGAPGQEQLAALMRAAHSLKGAARIVGLDVGVRLAHAMEDCFVAAQQGGLTLAGAAVDLLLAGVDAMTRLAATPESELGRWEGEEKAAVDQLAARLAALKGSPPSANGAAGPAPFTPPPASAAPVPTTEAAPDRAEPAAAAPGPPTPSPAADGPVAPAAENREALDAPAGAGATGAQDRVLRVSARHLNRLLGLAGEAMVETRWVGPFGDALLRLKRQYGELARDLDVVRNSAREQGMDEATRQRLTELQSKVLDCRQAVADRMVELERFDRRSANLSQRLYGEALACRMRPFADGIEGFPRLVRDLARRLGKEVRYEVVGEATQVDRDILEQLEAPLGHLLRNAVDHGVETPEARLGAGKPAQATVRLEARHSAGMLWISVTDDGRGVDLDGLRAAVVRRNLASADTAARLSEAEMLDFLFLPGFSVREAVTEISGRGVGLDVVATMVRQVRGVIRVFNSPGRGVRFQLQLPLTLSVLRALLVEIGGEPYAFPLAYIARTLRLPAAQLQMLEGRQHFELDGRQIGLVTAHQVLGQGASARGGDTVCVVVIGAEHERYGLVVDGFLGERELVVQPLDPRLGKVKDVSAGAILEDGAPVLILDVEDCVRSIERLLASAHLDRVSREGRAAQQAQRKRVLVVDDSLTVRELERKLLQSRGYEVETAVDGLDGWNAARTGHFHLIVTDVDMPRMDGIDLVRMLRKDTHTRALPIMIVSYKDREEDRQRGLEAGADHYLTKGSFHDERLLQAVVDLIGAVES